MNSSLPDGDFDRWLSQAMRARRGPQISPALAERVLATAKSHDASGASQHLLQRWRWGLRINLLANVVVMLFIVIAVAVLLQSFLSSSVDLSTNESASTGLTNFWQSGAFQFFLAAAGAMLLLFFERTFSLGDGFGTADWRRSLFQS